MSKKKRKSRANYNVQADNISAGAFAQGDRATATQNVTGRMDGVMLAAAVADLKSTLAVSGFSKEACAVMNQDMDEIVAESSKDDPDMKRIESVLESLISKIKLAGELTKGAADLIEPVKKIATAIGLGAAVVGLV